MPKRVTQRKLIRASAALLDLAACEESDLQMLHDEAIARLTEFHAPTQVPMYLQELVGSAFSPDHLVRIANFFSGALDDLEGR